MSKHGSLLRRIALAIIGYAMRVVPPDRSSWARGMRQEIDYIDFRSIGPWMGCRLSVRSLSREGPGHRPSTNAIGSIRSGADDWF